jgi:hypothetical protein
MKIKTVTNSGVLALAGMTLGVGCASEVEKPTQKDPHGPEAKAEQSAAAAATKDRLIKDGVLQVSRSGSEGEGALGCYSYFNDLYWWGYMSYSSACDGSSGTLTMWSCDWGSLAFADGCTSLGTEYVACACVS